MGGVDKAWVERVINEASAGSSFYVNEQRKAAARAERIARARAKLADFDAGRVAKLPLQRRCDAIEAAARAGTALGSFIHLDMDAFYASVEELLNPALKGVPFGVGGMGMLSTSNYAARQFGVRAGMPGYIAKKLCPQLVFAWSGHHHYQRFSDAFKAIVSEYDPRFRSLGLDEVTMDIGPFLAAQRARGVDASAAARLPDSGRCVALVDAGAVELPTHADASRCTTAEQVAWEIRARVYQATRLTASAGIAPTPALAKIQSNFEKPDGQSVLAAASLDDLRAFMFSQPIRRVSGVGRASDEMLAALGCTTCADLYADRVRLCHALTPKSFEFLLTASIGCQGTFDGFGGPSEANPEAADASLAGTATAKELSAAARGNRKSVGAERTFNTLPTVALFMDKAESVFAKALAGLREEGLAARQVGIKLKRKSFVVSTTTANLAAHTDDRDVLWAAFENLVAPHMKDHADFRLMGCRFSDIQSVNGGGEAVPLQQPTPGAGGDGEAAAFSSPQRPASGVASGAGGGKQLRLDDFAQRFAAAAATQRQRVPPQPPAYDAAPTASRPRRPSATGIGAASADVVDVDIGDDDNDGGSGIVTAVGTATLGRVPSVVDLVECASSSDDGVEVLG